MNITPIAAAVGNVTVSRSRTVNLGNYENEQVFVSVTVPVTNETDYQTAYGEALAFVKEKLEEEIAEATERSVNKVAKARPAKKEEKVEEAEVSETEETPVASGTTSTEKQAPASDVRKNLKEVKDTLGNDEYKSVMMKFGVKAVKDIDPDTHNEMIAECQSRLAKAAEAEEEIEEEIEDDIDDDLDESEEEETSVTKEDVTTALKEYNADHGPKSHLKILEKFGVTKVAELKESNYAKVIAECL